VSVNDVIASLAQQAPLVVVLALVLLLGLALLPIALRIAGLSGSQIVDTLALTLQFGINLIRAFRDENRGNLPPK